MTILLRRAGARLAGLSERWIPDAFVFAILLTLAVFLVALLATDRSAVALVGDWYGGFWNLLEFGMQMTLVLVTGHALAAMLAREVARPDVLASACDSRCWRLPGTSGSWSGTAACRDLGRCS